MKSPLIFAALLLLSVPVFAQTTAPMASSPAGQQEQQTSQTVSTELKDGSKIEIAPDNTVWVFDPAGVKTQAADGTVMLKDGSTITIKDGKKTP